MLPITRLMELDLHIALRTHMGTENEYTGKLTTLNGFEFKTKPTLV